MQHNAMKQVALALQGGGSHGAYTWGMLDRLLQEPALRIEAISGASAGAINAAVLAHGHARGGREGAREALHAFWSAVSQRMALANVGTGLHSALPESTRAFLAVTRWFSPYQFNPLNINPLRDILAEQIDFERLRAPDAIRLFVSATRVRDGALKIFENDALTLEALLASACLPSVHHTVEVDGEAYWDGGLSANPPLAPLVYRCRARDVVVVVLDSAIAEVPASAEAILERVTRMSFSSTFSNELQSVLMAKEAAERARFSLGGVDRRLRRMRLHVIEAAGYIAQLDPVTRYKTDAEFISTLRDEGRARADLWLAGRGSGGEARASAVRVPPQPSPAAA